MKKNLIQIDDFIDKFTFVDCGSRGEENLPLSQILSNFTFIGFEPDKEECKRLSSNKKPNHFYFPIAIDRKKTLKKFYFTRNPSCSSFFLPDNKLLNHFWGVKNDFTVTKQVRVKTDSLNSFLPTQKVKKIDFLKLDTQGSELDILKGADAYLPKCVGIKVEVEFLPMYKNQPLFSDIDSYLRKFGFQIFLLSGHSYRRSKLPTSGQTLWASALYLKDSNFPLDRDGLVKLAFISSFFGVHDYAMEILNKLCLKDRQFHSVRDTYIKELNSGILFRKIFKTAKSSFLKPFVYQFLNFFNHACEFIKNMERADQASWKN